MNDSHWISAAFRINTWYVSDFGKPSLLSQQSDLIKQVLWLFIQVSWSSLGCFTRDRLRSSIHQINQYEQISSDLFKLQSNPVYHICCCCIEFTNHTSVDMFNQNIDASPEYRESVTKLQTNWSSMHINVIDIIICVCDRSIMFLSICIIETSMFHQKRFLKHRIKSKSHAQKT